MTIDVSLAQVRELLHAAAAAVANALAAIDRAAAAPPPVPPAERRRLGPIPPAPAARQTPPPNVPPKEACRLIPCGLTKLYELIANREIDSFLDGRRRLITTVSIERRQARLLADPDGGKTRMAHLAPAHATLANNRRR